VNANNRIYRAVITVIFLVFVLLVPVQQITAIVPEPSLTEKRQLTPPPNVTLGSFLSKKFQAQFDMYMNDNFGFRSLMVMINNQINITIFHVTR
jgi:hypothetical protein